MAGESDPRDAREARVLAAPAVLLVGIFFVLPLLQVLWLSVTEPAPGLQNYRLLLESAAVHRTIGTTARLCLLTTVLSLAGGYIVAYALVHVGPRQRRVMFFFILVPFWLSVLARAFAWIALLRREGLVNAFLLSFGIVDTPLPLVFNELGVVIGMVHYMLPYAVLPLYATMRDIDRQLVHAARSLGAGPAAAFGRVFLPLSVPGLFSAATLVLVFSLGFYVTPVILGGGRTMMLAEYIGFNVLESVRWGLAAMLASALLATVLLVVALAARLVGPRLLGTT
jgi:putative spermidine/putrescine transport system permease protein